MAETRTRPSSGDPHNLPRVGVVGGLPHAPADQAKHHTDGIDGFFVRLGASMRLAEVAEDSEQAVTDDGAPAEDRRPR